ncbi:MAG: hypothetical protein QXT86_12105 [Archaeoglobaceae archaeon]
MFYKVADDYINLGLIKAITIERRGYGDKQYWSVRFHIDGGYIQYEMDEEELRELERALEKVNRKWEGQDESRIPA